MSDEDDDTAALVDKFYPDWELRVWRELVNGRYLVFLTYREQTYCLFPLSYPPKEHT